MKPVILTLVIATVITVVSCSKRNESNTTDNLPVVGQSEVVQHNQDAPTLNEPKKNIKKMDDYAGSYSFSDDTETGGVNFVYELVLDPVNSKASLSEGVVDINNSKGYCGTMFQGCEYWVVKAFNLNEDGNKAKVKMEDLDGNTCQVELVINPTGSITMSYLSGTTAPGVLLDENSNYTKKAKFLRD